MPDVGIGDKDVNSYNNTTTIKELYASKKAVDALLKVKDRLIAENSKLKKKVALFSEQYKAQKKQLFCSSTKKCKSQEIKSQLEALDLSPTQIKKLLDPGRQFYKGWTQDEISQAFTIKSLSSKTYR